MAFFGQIPAHRLGFAHDLVAALPAGYDEHAVAMLPLPQVHGLVDAPAQQRRRLVAVQSRAMNDDVVIAPFARQDTVERGIHQQRREREEEPQAFEQHQADQARKPARAAAGIPYEQPEEEHDGESQGSRQYGGKREPFVPNNAHRVDRKKNDHEERRQADRHNRQDDKPLLLGDSQPGADQRHQQQQEPDGVAELPRLPNERYEERRTEYDRRREKHRDRPKA